MIPEEQLKEWEEIEKKATHVLWRESRGHMMRVVESRKAFPLLLQAYREQQRLIEEQKKEIEKLNEKIEDIEFNFSEAAENWHSE